jgi:hypothetical protein
MFKLLTIVLAVFPLLAHADNLTGTWRATDGMAGTMQFSAAGKIKLAPEGSYEPLLGRYVATGHYLEIRPDVKTWQAQTSWFEVKGSTLTLRYDSGITQHFSKTN